MRAQVAVLAAAAALAGCGPEPVAAPTAPATQAAAPVDRSKIVLGAEWAAFGRSPATTRRFAFGSPRADVDAAASAAMGPPTDRSSNAECSEGPLAFSHYGPLRLAFREGRFTGWFVEEGGRAATGDGVRPGALIRDLRVTRRTRMISDSTLEGEFNYEAADGTRIFGFTSGEGRARKVASLYAGDTCFMR